MQSDYSEKKRAVDHTWLIQSGMTPTLSTITQISSSQNYSSNLVLKDAMMEKSDNLETNTPICEINTYNRFYSDGQSMCNN